MYHGMKHKRYHNCFDESLSIEQEVEDAAGRRRTSRGLRQQQQQPPMHSAGELTKGCIAGRRRAVEAIAILFVTVLFTSVRAFSLPVFLPTTTTTSTTTSDSSMKVSSFQLTQRRRRTIGSSHLYGRTKSRSSNAPSSSSTTTPQGFPVAFASVSLRSNRKATSSSSSSSMKSSSTSFKASTVSNDTLAATATATTANQFYPFLHHRETLTFMTDENFLVRDMTRQCRELQKAENNVSAATLAFATTTTSVLDEDYGMAKESSSSSATTTETTQMDTMINRARLLLIVAAALYGTNFSFVKLLGQSDIPVGITSTLRFGMASLATMPWLLPSAAKPTRSQEAADQEAIITVPSTPYWNSPEFAATVAGFEVGVWNSFGYVAQAVGLETTPASQSAFLCSLAVVVVPLLDYFLKGKPLTSQQTIGTLAALFGVALLELGFPGLSSNTATSLTFSLGDLASLFQPIAFGIGFWRMENAMHQYPNQAMRSTAAQLFAVFVASAMYCGFVENDLFSDLLNPHQLQIWLTNPTILLGLFWTGVITTALTVYMETVALETLSAAETTLIFSTEPLWGTACAACVMGEQLGLDTGVGALLIISGCLFSNLGMNGIKSMLASSKQTIQQTVGQAGQKSKWFTWSTKKCQSITDDANMLASRLVAPTAGLATAATTTNNDFVSKAANTATTASSSFDPFSLWNQMAVGAKVTMLQIESIVSEYLPEEWFIDL